MEQTIPAISVIVPVFNVERYVEKTLRGLIDQTFKGFKIPKLTSENNDRRFVEQTLQCLSNQIFKDFEVVIVYDSSSNATRGICQQFAQNDPRFRFIDDVGAQRFGSARNIGLTYARGKYVYFIDSGDVITDNALLSLYRTAEANNADVVHSTISLERPDVDVGDENQQITFRADKVQHFGLVKNPSATIKNGDLETMPALNLCRRKFLESHQQELATQIADNASFLDTLLKLSNRFYCTSTYFYINSGRLRTPDDAVELIKRGSEAMLGDCGSIEAVSKRQPESQVFVKDLDKDEVRDGYLVMPDRKQLWNAQLSLIREFDRVCRKHNIRWFTYGGTLLGAARHKGYIPWDDDIDIAMFRPDYKRFVEVAPYELGSHYFLDLWCNHRLEEELDELPTNEKYPLIPRNITDTIRQKHWYWPMYAAFAKLRDTSTALIQWKTRSYVNQGIWIDIFPLDPVPPFDNAQQLRNFEIAKEMILVAAEREKTIERLKAGEEFLMSLDRLEELLKMPFRHRALAVDNFLNEIYFESKYIAPLSMSMSKDERVERADFEELIDMPFELTTLPCPAGYDNILTSFFNDWRKIVYIKGHAKVWSTSLSSDDYFKKVIYKTI